MRHSPEELDRAMVNVPAGPFLFGMAPDMGMVQERHLVFRTRFVGPGRAGLFSMVSPMALR